jgi:isopenicillin N synthase-like dioxygenase
MKAVSTVDISLWRAGGLGAEAVAREVDEGLQRAGFLLVRGHGITRELAADVRAAARKFFALPESTKARYAAAVGERGWIGPGMEANGYSEGTETPPDLKETFAIGAETRTGDPLVDDVWFLSNVWPSEVAELHELLTVYTA